MHNLSSISDYILSNFGTKNLPQGTLWAPKGSQRGKMVPRATSRASLSLPEAFRVSLSLPSPLA